MFGNWWVLKPIDAALELDAGLGVTEDDVASERWIERGNQHAVLAPRVHHRERAHRIGAGAVGVQPLALRPIEVAVETHPRPRAVARRAPVGRLVSAAHARLFSESLRSAASDIACRGACTPSHNSIESAA